jgi:ABC-type sugar transport system permease subunit
VARLSATAARPSFTTTKASPRSRTNWSAYLYLLPSLVFLVAFSLWPAAESVYQSLFRINLLNPDRSFVGFGNYVALFNQALFWQVIENTALFSLVTVPVSVALALAFALLLNQKIALLGLWRTSIFYPTVLPMISGAAIWIFLYVPSYGLIDRVLALLGGAQTIALVSSVQAVDQVYLMTQGGPDNGTNLVVYLLYQIAFANWDTGQAAGLTVLLMVVLFGISWLNYRSLDRYTHYE